MVAAACHVYASHDPGTPPNRDETIEALRTILREKEFVGKQVVSALHEGDLLVKNLRFPMMPEAELASAVKFEAIDRVAGLDEDSEIRFILAGTVSGGNETQQEVVVLGAPAATLHDHLELVSDLGLESVGVDALPCAVFRTFQQYLRRGEDQEEVNVFVDIGRSSARIMVTRGDRIAFTKSFETGGAKFDQLVAESLSVDFARAGELRRSLCGDRCKSSSPIDSDTEKAVVEAVHGGLSQLGKEIGLCLRYYAVTFRGRRPDTITCVGGESLDADHLEHLSEATGLPCRVGFPLRSMTCGDAFGEDAELGPMADWATVAGLSMKTVQCAAGSVKR